MGKFINSALITNDDGYNAIGIKVLNKISLGLFDKVWVLAPKSNQSGKSHSITINKKLSINKIKNREYTLSGTPVDCAIIGLNKVMPYQEKPAIFLSGINIGINLGLDLIYSGTVAAAREASINGVKSIALSVDKKDNKVNWSAVNYFAPKIIKSLYKKKIPKNYFFNINFPSLSAELVKGCKVVSLGKRKPGSLITTNIINGKKIYMIPSERKILKEAQSGEDEFELRKKYITITIHNYNSLILSEKENSKLKRILGKIIE
jgi:5'-nucleotidase